MVEHAGTRDPVIPGTFASGPALQQVVTLQV
jgi:hypothetical protein